MWALKMDWKLQFQFSSSTCAGEKGEILRGNIFPASQKKKFIQNDSLEIGHTRFIEWALSIVMADAEYQSKLMEIYNSRNLAIAHNVAAFWFLLLHLLIPCEWPYVHDDFVCLP